MDKTEKWIPNNGSSTFDKIIRDDQEFKILPLTHKKTVFDAIPILETGTIQPHECEVFNHKLIYLFYGIPSYDIAQDIGSRKDSSYCPICFLLKHNNIKISNAFPFDTGAFKKNKYKKYMNDHMDLYDFALKTNIEYVNHFVSTFYNSNKDYYIWNPKKNLDELDYSYLFDFHIDSYIRMITKNEETEIDSRAHTIEIICENKIILSDSLLAIIAPHDYCEKKLIKEKYSNVDIIGYHTFYQDPPSSYNSVIKELVYNYLLSKKLL